MKFTTNCKKKNIIICQIVLVKFNDSTLLLIKWTPPPPPLPFFSHS